MHCSPGSRSWKPSETGFWKRCAGSNAKSIPPKPHVLRSYSASSGRRKNGRMKRWKEGNKTMKEIGCCFSSPMVRAILDGRKTQTRRIINPQPRVVLAQYDDGSIETNQIFRRGNQRLRCQVHPGDRIYVRETWGILDDKYRRCYFVDSQYPQGRSRQQLVGNRWRPSIHMPKAAARIWLEVTDVRPERLLDISSHDANCEGFTEAGTHPRAEFLAAWDQLYGSGAAEADPWVWVIEFRVI